MPSVLITRPQAQASGWVDAIADQGWQPVLLPSLVIEPVTLEPLHREWLMGLDRYTKVIVVSANAAQLGAAALDEFWPQWPVQQTWYAVGPATAEALLPWQVKPKVPSQHSSEGLLGLASLQQIAGERILILKGVGGRTAIADTLTLRGADVDGLPLYRREMPETAPQIVKSTLSDWLSQPQPVLAPSSGDGLKNLLTMVRASAPECLESLYATPVVVMSERFAAFARTKGFKQIRLAENSSGEALAAAVRCILGSVR